MGSHRTEAEWFRNEEPERANKQKPMKIVKMLSVLVCASVLMAGIAWSAEEKKPCCEPTVKAGLECKNACCKKAAEKGKVCKKCHKATAPAK